MTHRFYTMVIFVIALALGYLSYRIMQPFLSPIAWAATLAIVFYPIHMFILKYLKSPVLASVSTLAIVVALIIGPFTYFSYLLAVELSHILKGLQTAGAEGLFQSASDSAFGAMMNSLLGHLGLDHAEAYDSIRNSLKDVVKNLASGLSKGVGSAFGIGVDFVIMIFTLFFFLKDGESIIKSAGEFMPFSPEQKKKLIKQVKDIVISTLYGSVVVAIIQGLLAGTAYWLLGVPSPVLWGMLTAVVAFLPIVGAFVVWGPVAVYLFFESGILLSMIMVLTGIFVISLVDNILRPILIGERTKMPVLIIFFSVLGGIKFFGLIGFIAGPLVIALFMSIIKMFRNIQQEIV